MSDMFWEYSGGGYAGGGSRSGGSGVESSAKIDILEDRIDRLMLTCMAMWSLIQEETKLSEEDLLERIKAIDLMDGVADGKVTRQVAKCGKCDRPMSPRHARCIYCGHERLVMSAFDTLV